MRYKIYTNRGIFSLRELLSNYNLQEVAELFGENLQTTVAPFSFPHLLGFLNSKLQEELFWDLSYGTYRVGFFLLDSQGDIVFRVPDKVLDGDTPERAGLAVIRQLVMATEEVDLVFRYEKFSPNRGRGSRREAHDLQSGVESLFGGVGETEQRGTVFAPLLDHSITTTFSKMMDSLEGPVKALREVYSR